MKGFSSAILIFKKDLRSELRMRYVINALIMFVLVTISIIRFAVGDEKVEKDILNGLLWVVIFFASSGGLSRTFVKEEDKETSFALKLSAKPTDIFLGKFLYNLVLSFALNIMVILLFIAIMDFEIQNILSFVVVLILGNFGLVVSSTVIASIIAKADSKGTLYPVLSFPILLPLLLSVINASKLASYGASLGAISGELMILISYSIVVLTTSVLLFSFIWED
ncbi:MAG: heme exporter protein CcmB [Ignavibacteriae bacterium]|nr:heme exporter protein CcmB [Ignavibacteriota bacterium]MCB9243975.1 heme exporter protein CcmB [Ignavibacteriales bacterium]